MRVAAAVVLVAAAITAVAANVNLNVLTDERRVIDLGVFGYDEGGVFEMKVEDLFVHDPDGVMLGPDGRIRLNESIGFVLTTVTSAQDARYQRSYAKAEVSERICFIDDPDLRPAFDDGRFNLSMSGEMMNQPKSFSVTIKRAGLYALFFYNCVGFKDNIPLRVLPVTFNLVATQYNLVSGGGRNYLSVGHQPLPVFFGLCTVAFGAMTFFWTREMRRNPTHIHHVHRIMLFLLIVKTCSLFFEALKYSHYAATGHASVWDFFYYLFLTVKGVTLFGVVILLGTGWSFFKAMLSENDKKLLLAVVTAQVVVNVCLAVVEETNEGTKGWGSWSDLLRIADVLACSLVILPIIWSINKLRDLSDRDEKAAQTLARMRLFRTFYLVVVAYIYFTRIILVMIDGTVPYRHWWITNVFAELAAFCLYLDSGRRFRPMSDNPYLHVNKDDTEEIDERTEMTAA